MILKNVALMSPGIWKDVTYSKKELEKAFKETDWSRAKQVFVDHKDKELGSWIGYVEDQRVKGKKLYGTLVIVGSWSDKLKEMEEAGLKIGASLVIGPKITGKVNDGIMSDFVFDNFTLVLAKGGR